MDMALSVGRSVCLLVCSILRLFLCLLVRHLFDFDHSVVGWCVEQNT